MKAALALMGLACLAMVYALWQKGDGAFGQAMSSAGSNALKMLPILALAVFMMGAFEVLLPQDVVQRWLTDAAGFRGIGIAWLAGILTPAGSLVGMPIAAGLFKAGVSASVLVTYLVSLATLSIIRFPLEVGFLGTKLALLRIASCAILPPVAGLIVRALRPLYA